VHLPGVPFSNIFSFADGTLTNSTGNIYFFASPLDTSMHDLTVRRGNGDGEPGRRWAMPVSPAYRPF